MITLPWIPLGLIGILSWSVWFIRRTLSHHGYREVVNDFRTTTSLVVPVYREDADVLERCLRTWLAEGPTEIILVVDDRTTWCWRACVGSTCRRCRSCRGGTPASAVPSAPGSAPRRARSSCSPTPTRRGARGCSRPCRCRSSTRRSAESAAASTCTCPDSDLRRRVAYWLLNTRYLDYVPAMSRRGGVACLSGRTAAYRRSAITPLMPALEHEIFLGRECVAGDDGRLTWLVLAAGYRTVHQASAQADSMFPDSWTAFIRQRVRWSRNSYRTYLTALAQGWLWRQPLITQVTVLQILVTPLTMGCRDLLHGVLGARAVARSRSWSRSPGPCSGAGCGGCRTCGRTRATWRSSPLMALVVAGIALPIKVWAAFTMNRHGWLTRTDAERVQGQGEITGAARPAAPTVPAVRHAG